MEISPRGQPYPMVFISDVKKRMKLTLSFSADSEIQTGRDKVQENNIRSYEMEENLYVRTRKIYFILRYQYKLNYYYKNTYGSLCLLLITKNYLENIKLYYTIGIFE